MKKYIITLAIALGFGMNVNAQIGEYNRQYGQDHTDGFFSGSNYTEYREDVWADNMPLLPGQHGYNFDYNAEPAPLGSGLLLLAGMGLAYGIRRRK